MKALVGLVIVILLIFITNLFWPFEKTTQRKSASQDDTIIKASKKGELGVDDLDLSGELDQPSGAEKIELMTAAYDALEVGRKKLKRRLSRIKHDMWGLKFAPADAKKMSNIMLEAHKLIKNPDMRGAFSSVKVIEDEIAKIKFAEKSIEQVAEMIATNKKDIKKTN